MFKSAQLNIKKLALNVVNVGRPKEDVSLDTSDGGLLQSILGGFDSSNQPLIVVKVDDEKNAFSIEECIAKTQAAIEDIDFGMTDGEEPKEKTKTVNVISDDDKIKQYTVTPSDLQLPQGYKPTHIVLGGNNRTYTGLVAGQLQGGNYQLAHCHVFENYQDAVEAARKENILKDIGVKKMTKMDYIKVVQGGLADFSIKRECDLKNKLKIASRNMRQSIFGPAVKGNLIEELQEQLESGELDCVHSKLPVEKLSNSLGPKFLGADLNDLAAITAMLEKEVKPAGETKSKAMSGTDIKDMAKLSLGALANLLNAIATNDAPVAYQAMEQINQALK